MRSERTVGPGGGRTFDIVARLVYLRAEGSHA